MIGRTPDNVFVIPEDAVDRHHAIVDYREGAEGGQYVIRCLQREGYLEVDDQRVQELILQPGVRFKIGSGEFECLAAPEVTPSRQEGDWSLCPHCDSPETGTLIPGPGACPDCHKEVMVVLDNRNRHVVLPRQVKSCRLIRLIGQGGMAWVFEGQVEDRPGPVAVKILMPHLLRDEAALQRFRREVQTLQTIRHPRVLRRLGQGRWKNVPCLLTPLMPQGSLRQVMERLRREKNVCNFERALLWFQDVLEGLQALHEANLVHRDVKPSNILMDGGGRAVIADLGIARKLDSQTASLTATGTTVGTYQYMAPEQFDNPEGVDHRADLYAVGVVFYELLTGQLPRGRWVPASRINPSVPASFDAVLERLLEPVDKRFSSVKEIFEALSRCDIVKAADERAPIANPVTVEHLMNENNGQQTIEERDTKGALPRLKAPSSIVLVLGGVLVAALLTAISTFVRVWELSPRELVVDVSAGLTLTVPSVNFGSDGRRLLIASGDGAVYVYSIANGNEVMCLKGHEDRVRCVACSAEGQQILTGSADKTARLWNAMTGTELRRFEGHSDWVNSVAFSPDGRHVLTGSWDKTAILWDAATGQRLRTFEGHSADVNSVAFSPDGQQVLTGSDDGTAILWDGATGQRLRTFEGHSADVNSVAFSPDGQQVLTGSDDGTAILWDGATGQRLRTFEGHTRRVNSVAFSPDGRQVLTGSDDDTAILWDVATGQRLRTFEGHSRPVLSVAFSPDGRQVLTGSDDDTAILWDVATGQRLRTFWGHKYCVNSVAFSPDGRQVLTGSDDGTAILWDGATGQRLRTFQGHSDSVTSVAFSPDGRHVLTGSLDNTAILWDVATGKEVNRFEGHTDAVNCVLFSKNPLSTALQSVNTEGLGRAIAGRDAGVLLNNSSSGMSKTSEATFDRVITCSSDRTIRIWNVGTGEELKRIEGHFGAVNALASTPDGRYILSGSDDKTVRLWDVMTGKECLRFDGHTGGIYSVALSPDATQLLTASGDRSVRLWDVATGKLLVNLKGHTGPVMFAAFTPEGRRLVTASLDGTARLWNLESGKPLCYLIHFTNGGWAAITPQGFTFDCGVTTQEHLLKIIWLLNPLTRSKHLLSEADIEKFYRPDIVARVLQQ
jgi:WD40 repeat protein/tRNA A-37 threonylcarbamoyl transferase component Bud32